MKKNILLILLSISLLALNIYLLIQIQRVKQFHILKIQQMNEYLDQVNQEMNVFKSNFLVNLENGNLLLDNIFIKNAYGELSPIDSMVYESTEYTLICRFSEKHCEKERKDLSEVEERKLLFLDSEDYTRMVNPVISYYKLKDF